MTGPHYAHHMGEQVYVVCPNTPAGSISMLREWHATENAARDAATRLYTSHGGRWAVYAVNAEGSWTLAYQLPLRRNP